MKLERVRLERLTPNPTNVRHHDRRNVEAIKASLSTFGQQKPIVVDSTGVVIAGNAVLTAAKELDWLDIAVIRTGLRGRNKDAYAIADNRTGDLSCFDSERLTAQLIEISKSQSFDLESIGFYEVDLQKLITDLELEAAKDAESEKIPDKPKRPISKRGDLWILDRHRLTCGDATIVGDIRRVLREEKPLIMVTDPPYGVEYDANWRNKVGRKGKSRSGKVQNDDIADWRAAYELFPGSVAYVWHAAIYAGVVWKNLIECSFEIRSQIIWAKQNLVLSRGAYHWKHEPCWYAVRKLKNAQWRGGRTQTTLWEVANANPFGGSKEDALTEHSTQKPIECMARPIRNHGGKSADVYDPFLGSGTTIIAAEQLGRRCYGLELDPGYCDVIVQRWQNLTGGKAKRKAA